MLGLGGAAARAGAQSRREGDPRVALRGLQRVLVPQCFRSPCDERQKGEMRRVLFGKDAGEAHSWAGKRRRTQEASG